MPQITVSPSAGRTPLVQRLLVLFRKLWVTMAGKAVVLVAGMGMIAAMVYGLHAAGILGQTPISVDKVQKVGQGQPSGTKTQGPGSSKSPATGQATKQTSPAPQAAPAKPAAQAKATSGASAGGFQRNCIVVPSSCGYPDATNTGVPPGTPLTNSGSITVTQDGAVISNLNINGTIMVQANNVTIRKVRITSDDYYPIRYDDPYRGLLVEDTEIIGTSSDVTAGISFANFTARRVNIHGTADGIKADSNAIIEDSYIHDLFYDAVKETHNDGVQTTGGSNVTVRHNTFKLSMTDGINACLQIGTEWGPDTDWLVTNNLFDGGGWIINSRSLSSSMQFLNNRFTHNSGYGVGAPDGSTWSGNYFDSDGAPILQD
jgi:hypothetical protein